MTPHDKKTLIRIYALVSEAFDLVETMDEPKKYNVYDMSWYLRDIKEDMESE